MLKSKFLRLATALSIAGIVAGQIPLGNAGVAFADAYEPPVRGSSTSDIVVAGGVVLVAYGALSASSESGSIFAGKVMGRPIGTIGAIRSADFSTVQSLIDAADLKAVLSDSNAYTFFAPTNSALNQLSADAIADLLKPANKAELAKLLRGHIVSGRYTIADLRKMADNTPLPTLDGSTVVVTNAGGLKVNGIPVTSEDVAATNGWIHPLQGVIVK